MSFGLSFQQNKVNRLILVNGEEFEFERRKVNDFGEPIKDEPGELIKVKGLYHEVNSFVSKVGSEASTTRSKPQPMILCMNEEGAKVKRDDLLTYKGTKYKVVEIANPVKLDICLDISLEVVQDG